MKKAELKGVFLAILAIFVLCTTFGCTPQSTPTPAPTPYGHYCSLQAAYDEGNLKLEQLKSIAWYNHQNYTYNEAVLGDDYEPLPLSPTDLTSQTAEKIRNDYYYYEYYVRPRTIDFLVPEDVQIKRYLGTYNGGVVVYIDVNRFAVLDNKHELMDVAGVRFLLDSQFLSDHEHIIVWYPSSNA